MVRLVQQSKSESFCTRRS